MSQTITPTAPPPPEQAPSPDPQPSPPRSSSPPHSSSPPPAPSPPDAAHLHDDSDQTTATILLSSIRLQSLRLRIAKARAEFEQTLLTLLTLNVIYMYYIDHSLLVLLIRASQLIRLLYFPYASLNSQRSTAILLLVSNFPVLVVHNTLFAGPGSLSSKVGEMLFINFIGPEPKSIAKVVAIDLVTIALQLIILQCRCDPVSVRLLSALPVPVSEPLAPVADDPPAGAQPSPQAAQDADSPPPNAT